jgi:hypothetical protein
MTLYFFHCSDLDGHHSDTWGLDLPDPESALAIAPAFLTEAPSPGASPWRMVEIEDETGRPLMTVPRPLPKGVSP